MKRRAVLILFVLLAACGAVSLKGQQPISPDTIEPLVQVVDYEVIVPRSLTTSEAHVYYPLVDIVWRGDPPGDRYDQVAGIFSNSLNWGMAAFNHGRRVTVTIELLKFHAISEKARYSVGGVHTIRFLMSVKDASTGAVIMAPEKVVADLKAFGGANAVRADALGQTQKARITQHLAGTMQQVMLAHGLGHLLEAAANGG